LVALLPAPLAAQGAFFEGGLLFARGDDVYVEPTNSGSFSAGLGWSAGRLTLRATVPVFVRDTRLLELRSALPAAAAPTSTRASYDMALTDPFLQAHVALLPPGRTALGVVATVKVPVAAAGEFGTGRWDYGVGASVSRTVGSASLLGLDLGYWRLGDPPDLELQDVLMGSVTLGHSLTRRWSASVSLSGSRSAIPGYDDPCWLGLLVGRASGRGMLGVTLSAGLTPTAPDFGVGLIWRVRLGD
jgi:hypothetical protein